jgi:uncharacterized protein YqeY
MNLKDKIQSDYITALKNKEDAKKSALSSVKAKITESEKVNGTSISDNDVIKVLGTLIKQREQSIDAFKKGNRQDLVDKETSELSVIKSYLPQQLTDDEITTILSKFIGTMSMDNRNKMMGMAMGHMSKTYTGQFDTKKVQEIINIILQ